jgi:hypothetical protein
MTITIRIDSNTMQSKIDIRMLDVQIDTRLKWGSHVRKIQEKTTKQFMILTKLSTFTWEAIFRKARMLYIFVVRSVLIYEFFVWLKIETHVVFIDIHLDHLQTQIRYRMRIGGISAIIRKECRSITNKLSNVLERIRLHRLIFGELKHERVKQQLSNKQKFSSVSRSISWADFVLFDLDVVLFHRQRKNELHRFHADRWKKRWITYAFFVLISVFAQIGLVDKSVSNCTIS